MKKIVQHMKEEMELLKKTQIEVKLEMKNLGTRTEILEASLTKIIQEMEDRVSSTEDKIGDKDTAVKENVKSTKKERKQNPGTKHPGNLGYYENTKNL